MNIFRKVTLKTLLRNKTRTLVTIIGIILSASMITAVTTLISSLQRYMLEVAVHDSGDWHGALCSVTPQKIDELKNDKSRVSQVAYLQNIGYSYLDGSINEDKPYLFVAGADETFFKTMPIVLTEGRFPENTSEIILPKHLAANGGIICKTGDILQLPIGDRISEGAVLKQYNPYQAQSDGKYEELTEREARSYTVVGFYNRPSFELFSAPGYTALTVADEGDKGYTFDVYFKMKDPKEVYYYLNTEAQEDGFNKYYDNRDVLMYSGASRYNTFYGVLYSLAAILIVLIMFGSISLIYNAFAISVSERTRQFGLLSSVGATKKQIRSSVLFEALVVSVAGIPLGILSGIAGIAVTLACVGGKFSSLYGGEGLKTALSIHISIWAVVIAAIVALVTVLFSAWIPSRRATRITAIEAVRQTKDILIKGRHVKTSWLTYSLFGLEGVLARKYFKRSRKKYRATVVSLFMSIVLFISASSFCGYLKDSVGNVFETRDYDIEYSTYTGNLGEVAVSELYEALRGVSGVTGSNFSYLQNGILDIDSAYLSNDYKKYNEGNMGYAMCYVVEDEAFVWFLENSGLNPDKFMDGKNPSGIALSTCSGFNYSTQRYERYTVFSGDRAEFTLRVFDEEKFNKLTKEEKESVEIDDTFYIPVPVKVDTIVDRLPMGVNGNLYGTNVTVMYPESLADRISPHLKGSRVACFFTVKNHRQTYDEMASVLTGFALDNGPLQNYAAMSETNRNLIIIINVFSYGFIVLISLIAAANVFNTISTNISLRRREFAMLKSVGMTRRGFLKMMNYECLLYGMKSLFWGLPVSFAMTYLIYRSINIGYTGDFHLPWSSILVAVLSVFAVVFSTMMYSMRKINRDNPIDAIRNENL